MGQPEPFKAIGLSGHVFRDRLVRCSCVLPNHAGGRCVPKRFGAIKHLLLVAHHDFLDYRFYMSRPESRILRSAADVIAALTPAEVSALTGKPYKSVWQWGDDGKFPSRYFAVMTWALRKKRLRAHPSLWGQVTTPEMEQMAA